LPGGGGGGGGGGWVEERTGEQKGRKEGERRKRGGRVMKSRAGFPFLGIRNPIVSPFTMSRGGRGGGGGGETERERGRRGTRLLGVFRMPARQHQERISVMKKGVS